MAGVYLRTVDRNKSVETELLDSLSISWWRSIIVANETIGSEEIPELPDRDQLIMVCGNRSKQASGKLAALGYTNIVEFGGILDWPDNVVSGTES